MFIRKAKLKDLDILSKMSLNLLKHHQKFDKYFTPSKDAKNFLKSFFKKCVYSKKFYVMVACLDDEIIGYGLAGLSSRPPIFKDRKIGFIYDVYVEKKHRRKGVNKMFLAEMYDWFKKNNLKNIELSVHSMNELGNKVWDKEKFRTISIKKHKVI